MVFGINIRRYTTKDKVKVEDIVQALRNKEDRVQLYGSNATFAISTILNFNPHVNNYMKKHYPEELL